MSKQMMIPLWDLRDGPLRARRADPDTSHEAAAKVNFAGEHHRKILLALETHGNWFVANIGVQGGTKDDIAKFTGLDPTAVARRMRELERAGRVEDSGERRPTRTGRKAIVWRLRT